MEDRRIFDRVPVELSLRFLNLWETKEGKAVTTDISAKGVGILTDEPVPSHTALEIWFKVPGRDEPLYTRGEVAWSVEAADNNKFRVGINLEKAYFMGFSKVLTEL